MCPKKEVTACVAFTNRTIRAVRVGVAICYILFLRLDVGLVIRIRIGMRMPMRIGIGMRIGLAVTDGEGDVDMLAIATSPVQIRGAAIIQTLGIPILQAEGTVVDAGRVGRVVRIGVVVV